MLKIERFAKIEAELKQKGSLDIPSLSQLLGCSEETVRRDLRELEAVGKLNRIRGGAYLSDKYDKTYASPLRRTLYQEEKNQMSLKAMEFIHDRDVIFLDSSTTCLALARTPRNLLAAMLMPMPEPQMRMPRRISPRETAAATFAA